MQKSGWKNNKKYGSKTVEKCISTKTSIPQKLSLKIASLKNLVVIKNSYIKKISKKALIKIIVKMN